mmetsp:Transcript_4296/g.9566  ORF Transcript_4296/g.9566 Transcript_4296/m.9566 type:complete len:100 (+) Transcript_4296:206-505(+)|eukprot:CAMPEP_0171330526 /NCGR_PEP_ID=MMETSP0878-20121228/2067_1 /TAXON_ID=67004 /ORGANISM="Thalassiosira weissflogii, Strain CCMP1336" /LENGTH=99 /DNA_ID=CAMNT_0011830843 /DNA_START=187 /DNA_END=486 /DNA_ORIENTATION=-
MPVVSLVVEVNVKEDRRDEFLQLIEKDAVASRNEPGCLRFDVIETADDPNKFIFYELYSDEDAVAYHNEQPYLLDVVKFVESGGMDIVIKRAVGKFMTD